MVLLIKYSDTYSILDCILNSVAPQYSARWGMKPPLAIAFGSIIFMTPTTPSSGNEPDSNSSVIVATDFRFSTNQIDTCNTVVYFVIR